MRAWELVGDWLLLCRFEPFIVFGVGVVNNVDAELVAGFPHCAWDAGMAVGPGVANVAGMIVGDEPSVHHPTKGVGATVGRDDGEAGQRVGNAVDGVVEVDGDWLDSGEDLLHHGNELSFPTGAPAVVAEKHAVVLEEVATHDFEFLCAQVDVLLAGHVDHGRAFAGREALEATNLHRFGAIADGVAGADSVFGEEVEVGAAVHVLFPIAAVVFQADEADFSSGCASREAGAIAFSLADFVEVLGDFEDLQFDVIDRWWVEEDTAVGVDDIFLIDDLLDFDDLLELGLFASAEWRFVEAAAREAGQDEGHDAEEASVGEESEDGLAKLVVLVAKIPGHELARVPSALFGICFAWFRRAFCFAVDPPDGPSQPEEEGSGGAELDQGGGEGVGEVEEGEMGQELPEGEVANAEDGAANDSSSMTLAADPVEAEREGGEESDCEGPHPQSEPGMGIDPKQTPEDRVDSGQ